MHIYFGLLCDSRFIIIMYVSFTTLIGISSLKVGVPSGLRVYTEAS